MTTLAQVSLIASAAGFAAAGSLELDRMYAADLRSDATSRALLANDGAGIRVGVGLRFNYTMNSRDDTGLMNPDDDTTIGFSFDDVEVRLSGDVTDSVGATISFDFGEGDAALSSDPILLEDAYVDWAINDGLTLRIGQFVPEYSAEASTSEYHMTNGERSVTHEWLATPSWTQGIEARFGGDTWSGAVGLTDGPSSGNTAFRRGEADFAFNIRFDVFSDSDKARFADQTSWRGSASAWRIGAGVLYNSYGQTSETNFVNDVDTVWYTVDAAYEGDGWALRASFYGNSLVSNEPAAGSDSDSYGFEIGGSLFFDDQWEGYARYDMLMIDDIAVGPGQIDTYSFVALGANYYLIPESHAAKLQFEVGIALDATGGAEGVLANTTGPSLGVAPIGEQFGSSSILGSAGFLGSADSGEFYASVRATLQF